MNSNRIIGMLLLFGFIWAGCKKQKGGGADSDALLYRVVGNRIVDANNQPVRIAGVAFGNEVWTDKELPYTHHGAIDYQRVKNMGMNAIRFYLNYKTFENDDAPYTYKESGWRWLDENIAWARANGVYLILNMHVPQGGFQSLGTGDALWNNMEHQNRLAALWKAIAARYAREQQIIGFGPLNEPVPTQDISQWEQLAQRLADEIRSVDKNHILFIERAIYVKSKPETADYNFPRVNVSNAVLEFHFYDPFSYTHQLFSWANMGEGGRYPDESVITATDTRWYTATFNNPALAPGTSGWQYVEGVKYVISDNNIKLALPALVGAAVGGKVYFDDVVIKEYDAAGNFVQEVLRLSLESQDGWGFWSSNNTGSSGLLPNAGIGNTGCLFIANASGDCNISNYNHLFVPRPGFAYQASGWMKGEALATASACKIRLDFLTSPAPIFSRNKAYLEAVLKKFTNWAAQKNVPLYMGEFGAGIHCFQNGKGGLQWVTDMVDIAQANQIYFTYHTYHEDNFGLYFGYGSLPDPSLANQPLIDLFTAKLR
jgi:endoglucanase